MLSVVFLPRQFQIMVVENVDEHHLRRAAWVFPLYLLLINLFVLPIAIGGLLYIYYNQFVAPPVAGLQSSAEVLLMVISGGTGTLLGPIAGAAIVIIIKNVVSAWIERWNLVLGLIFVIIISFMPDGLVPGIRRLWRTMRGTDAAEAAAARASAKLASGQTDAKEKGGVH